MPDYGEFGDLVPQKQSASGGFGEFADLVPKQPEPVRTSGVGGGFYDYSDWRAIAKLAEAKGFTVTGKNEKQGHNVGSRHYDGKAIDVRTRDKTEAEIQALIAEAQAKGYRVVDERTRPNGQKVWTGPHLHIEIPRNAQSKAPTASVQPRQASTPNIDPKLIQ